VNIVNVVNFYGGVQGERENVVYYFCSFVIFIEMDGFVRSWVFARDVGHWPNDVHNVHEVSRQG